MTTKTTLDIMFQNGYGNCTPLEKELIKSIGRESISRSLLSKDEIRMANNLVKLGILEKGHFPKTNRIQFNVPSWIIQRIEN